MACEGLRGAGLDAGQAQIRVSNRKLFDGLFDAGGVTEAGQRLTALRAIDKFDRLGWDGVVQLLGEGQPGRLRRLHQGRSSAGERHFHD